MNESEIFLGLFKELQKAGFQLGFNQYLDFLELYSLGYGTDSRSLFQLLKALWVPEIQQVQEFRLLFEAYMGVQITEKSFKTKESASYNEGARTNDEANNLTEQSKNEENFLGEGDDPFSDVPEKGEVEKNKGPDPEGGNVDSNRIDEDSTKEKSVPIREIFLSFQDDKGTESSENQPRSYLSLKKTKFIFSDEQSFPFTRRTYSMLLKKVRLKHTYGETRVLAIKDMIEQLVNEGGIHKLAYEKKSSYLQNVIILTDHGGSMGPFEGWADTFFQYLFQDASISSISRYYFRDVPIVRVGEQDDRQFVVFENLSHTISRPFHEILQDRAKSSTWLIIFGDAGANDSSIKEDRLSKWLSFLSWTKAKVGAISWINPLPEERWNSTMAIYLALFTNMFPLSEEGARASIKQANYDAKK